MTSELAPGEAAMARPGIARDRQALFSHRIGARDAVGIIVSLLCLAAVVLWALGQQRPHFPTSATSLALVAAGVALYGLTWLLRGFRWHVILRKAQIEHERRDAYALVAVGYMGNTVLPARGGEVLRVLLMADRSSANRRQVIGSLVAERLLDALGLVVLFCSLTWSGLLAASVGRAPAAVAAAVFVTGLACTPFYLRLRAHGRVGRVADALRPFSRASRVLLNRTGLGLTVLTVLVWLCESLIAFVVGKALGLHISLIGAAFVIVLASFAAVIPAAPGYIGTFDGAVVFALHSLKVSGGQALAFTVLVRFILFVPVTAVGLALVLSRYGGLRMLRRSGRNRAARGLQGVRRPHGGRTPRA